MKALLALLLLACACGADPPPPTAVPIAPRITDDTPPGSAPSSAPIVTDTTPPVALEPAPPPDPEPEPTPAAPPTMTNAPLAALIDATCPPSKDASPPRKLSAGARSRWGKTRALGLLVIEIHQLEQLANVTATTARDRPLIDLRAALDYFELEARAYEECSSVVVPTGASPAEIARAEALVRARASTIAKARAAALAGCASLKQTYPTFAASHRCPP
jgi:hypothetical protein